MNGESLLNALRLVPGKKDCHLASLDQLHKLPEKIFLNPAIPKVIVIAANKEQLSHWVLVYIHQRVGVYIDSLAKPVPLPIERLLRGCCERWYSLCCPVQTLSSLVCGQACIYFACRLLGGEPVERILATIPEHPRAAEQIFLGSLCRRFQL